MKSREKKRTKYLHTGTKKKKKKNCLGTNKGKNKRGGGAKWGKKKKTSSCLIVRCHWKRREKATKRFQKGVRGE